MSIKVKKKQEDDEWIPGQSERLSKSKTDMHCIIHCTDSTEKLVMLPSMESWNKLIEAAKIRQNQTVLNLILLSLRMRVKCQEWSTTWNVERISYTKEVMIIILIKVFTWWYTFMDQTPFDKAFPDVLFQLWKGKFSLCFFFSVYYSELAFQVIKESLTGALNEGKQEEEELTPLRMSSRQSSGESSSSGSTTILPNKCIFCMKDKHLKKSRNREKLTNCLQLRADETIR